MTGFIHTLIHRRGLALAAIIAAVALFYAAPSRAGTGDPMIDGAKMCTQYFAREERKHGIPVHLLAAIASTESGRYHKGLKINLPWPWTINAAGQGYFFNSKAEAVAKVRALWSKGVRSIDVGCMQVNLKHHPKAFANIDQAFDPAYNVAYAARFLRSNFDDIGSWQKAAAAYHSRTPVHGNRYLKLVAGAWGNIVTRLKDARSSNYYVRRPGDYQDRVLASLQQEAPAKPAAPKTYNVSSTLATGQAEPKTSYQSPRMKVIQVSSAPKSKAPEVLVVRPTAAPVAAAAASLVPAEAKPLTSVGEVLAADQPAAATPNVTVQPRVVQVHPARMGTSTRKSGPHFIFSN